MDDVIYMVIYIRSSNYRGEVKFQKICQFGLGEYCYYFKLSRWRVNFFVGFCCFLINVYIYYVNIMYYIWFKGCFIFLKKIRMIILFIFNV